MPTEEQVREQLKEVFDPELRMDIVTLGLIYKIEPDDKGHVDVLMTFTSMMCPYGPQLVDEIKGEIIQMDGVKTVEVTVTFDPPWKPSEEVMATLGV